MVLDFDALVLAPCNAVFGEAACYYPGGGPMLPLQGIFADKFTATSFQDGAEIVSVRTALNVRATLFPKPPIKGELFRVRGVLYVINEVEPDGMGDIRFYLGVATDTDAARTPLPPS